MNKQSIVIVDYGMGNLRSVAKVIEELGDSIIISNKKDDLEKAGKIILPGVGAFSAAMKNLIDLDLVETLNNEVLNKGKPILGICLGMQLMARYSDENNVRTEGLNWVNAIVKPFDKSDELRVPHMGWNHISLNGESPLFNGLAGNKTFYFVHSYNMQCEDKKILTSTCDYGEEFAASIQKDNIFGTQFHPEKSQANGTVLIENFMNWRK